MQDKTLLQAVLAFIFGNKYYVNVFHRRGTPMCEISSFIFASEDEAYKHRKQVESSSTFGFVETITFRSKNLYKKGEFQGIEATLLAEQ